MIAHEIRNSTYLVLECDEVTYVLSIKEQVNVCLRWVGSRLAPHEDYIGLHIVDNITTDVVVHVLKDTVHYINLNVSMCYTQYYDDAPRWQK